MIKGDHTMPKERENVALSSNTMSSDYHSKKIIQVSIKFKKENSDRFICKEISTLNDIIIMFNRSFFPLFFFNYFFLFVIFASIFEQDVHAGLTKSYKSLIFGLLFVRHYKVLFWGNFFYQKGRIKNYF